MSIGMNIALIVALALAATGISTQQQAGVSNSSTEEVRGQNLNHNETLVSDTTLGQPTDNWLAVEQSFTSRLFTSFSLYRAGAGCSPWICGSNHNETLVSDTTTSPRAEDPVPLTVEQSVTSRLFTSLAFYRGGAVCPPWMCNHNETLVRDTTTSARAEDPAPLAVEQSFTSRLFISFSLYRAGAGCSPWVCGANHNETLVSALAPML